MNAPLSYPLQTQTPLRLGLLTHHNPFDRRAFSGTVYFAARALGDCPDVELAILGPHRAPRPLDRLLRRSSPEVRIEDISFDGLDAVIGIVGSRLLDPYLATAPDIPVIHVTDATPAFLRETYGWHIPAEADAAEARIARRASLTVYSSPDIAERAGRDLNLPGLRPAAIPFGVNIDALPGSLPEKPPLSRLKLLFVGTDWERKGGDIAVAALDALRASGIAAEMTIVGRCPKRHRRHEAITYAGFLDKNRPGDAARLNRLNSQAHLLLLPSRGDCTPMVLGEAMAFGTPVLAADTGGVGSVIGGAGAGRVLAQFTSPEDWAKEILACTKDRDAYRMMSDAAFDRARTTLSWEAWSRQLAHLAADIVAARAQPLHAAV